MIGQIMSVWETSFYAAQNTRKFQGNRSPIMMIDLTMLKAAFRQCHTSLRKNTIYYFRYTMLQIIEVYDYKSKMIEVLCIIFFL